MKKAVGIIGLIFCIAVIAVALWGYNTVMNDVNGKEKGEATNYTLIIDSSDFQYQVAEKLTANGIVINDSLWMKWMDKHYPDFIYINGEYNMNSAMSYEEIAQKLQDPDISHRTVKVAIPEGYNVFDIARTMEENGICSAEDFYEAASTTQGYNFPWLADLPTDNENIGFILEGFLFPATYDIGENTPAREVVEKMLRAFDDRLSSSMINYCEKTGMSLYEFITLCSIVQEEALTPDSAANIASVLINRLDSGTKLQCDVTYYYAQALLDFGFSRDVYDSYYTYRCPALPSGPITNSGMEVINSVIDHPDTDYLFFFSDLQGEFHFAATGAEFERLKNEYPWH